MLGAYHRVHDFLLVRPNYLHLLEMEMLNQRKAQHHGMYQSRQRGTSLVDYVLIITILSVSIMAAVQSVGRGARDALCSPVGGLVSVQGKINAYHWSDTDKHCVPVTNEWWDFGG
jgi:hypothetical protein